MDFDCPITPFEATLMTPQISETPIVNETHLEESWPINQTAPERMNNEQYEKQESVIKIKDSLKLSCTSQTRQPTPSPFFRNCIQVNNNSTSSNNFQTQIIQPERNLTNEPTTAEVLNDIDSLRQKSSDVKTEFIPKITDNTFAEISQNEPMVTSVSPKKRLIIRSQSQTDSTASNVPAVNNIDQAEKLLIESNNLMDVHTDAIQNGNLRFTPIPSLIVKEESHGAFHTQIENRQLNLARSAAESNPVHSTRNTSYGQTTRTKRSNELPLNGQKPVKMTQSQGQKGLVIFNEVSSSTPLQERKRLKTMTPTMGGYELPAKIETDGFRNSVDGDEHRKKLIRDSNREAARRCRERRRQYIEHLESDLDKLKQDIQLLQEKLGQLERENVQLRSMLAETNVFSNRRPAAVDSSMDFHLMKNANSVADSIGVQRNFHNRSHH